MTVRALMNELTSADIAEYMAADRLKDEKYRESLKMEMMTSEQQEEQLMLMLGYKE